MSRREPLPGIDEPVFSESWQAEAFALTVALAGSGLVAAAGTSQAATAQTAAKGCYVTASSAKVRSKASTGSTTVGVAYKGNRCQEKDVVIKGSHFWYKVRMTTGP